MSRNGSNLGAQGPGRDGRSSSSSRGHGSTGNSSRGSRGLGQSRAAAAGAAVLGIGRAPARSSGRLSQPQGDTPGRRGVEETSRGEPAVVDERRSSRGNSAGHGEFYSAPGVPSTRSSNRGATDPFGLDGDLFEFITAHEHNSEAFVGYRALGHPMVLHSLVDGSALASVHLRVVGSDAHALITRRPDSQSAFQGIVSADQTTIEIVMTNLTTEDVMTFDIGGQPRSRDDAYWDRTDVSFWSGSHRNDNRINKSNVLWPMRPNVCAENNLHFIETGEHRRIRLLARDNAPLMAAVNGCPAGQESGYPIFVYPRYNSRTALKKFARTAWSCPQTIVVIGTPSLIDEVASNRNIHQESRGSGPGQQLDAVGMMASTFGLSKERLLEVLEVDDAFLAELPEELQSEVLSQQLNSVDPQLLRPADDEPEPSTATSSSALSPAAAGGNFATGAGPTQSSGESVSIDTVALGARPAQLAAGSRLASFGGGRVLVERYDFEGRGAPATLSLGVDERVQMLAKQGSLLQTTFDELRDGLTKRISELVAGHTEALKEEVGNVYSTSECVICLTGDPAPDVILFQCGHRCVHLECLTDSGMKRCPLCRSPIAALLPCC